MNTLNYSTQHINQTHEIDSRLAQECLESEQTSVEDKQDAVREKITKLILLKAFNEQNVAKSYQVMNRSRDRLKLSKKAKKLLQNDSYIAEITEWYQSEHAIPAEYMPTITVIARSVRKEIPELVQVLFESLPPESVLQASKQESDAFFDYADENELDEFDLEVEFEKFLQMKSQKGE